MDFDAARIVAVVDGLRTDPASTPRQLISYLGHYGVQVFIALSAYGLTRKFSAGVPRYRVFLKGRVAKIYPMFLLSIALYLVRAGWAYGWLGPFHVLAAEWESLLLKVTLLSNVVPDQALLPVGPWWFVPFIFQFYAIFPFLFAAHCRWGVQALLMLSLAALVVAIVGLPVPVMTTVLGHLPEFCLGIWLGARRDLRVPRAMLVAAVPVFVLGNLSLAFWYVSHLSALILILGIWEACGPRVMRQRAVHVPFAFLGALSLPLFLVNGFLRQPILSWAQTVTSEARILGFALLFLLISVAVAWCLQQIDRLLRSVWLERVPRVARAS